MTRLLVYVLLIAAIVLAVAFFGPGSMPPGQPDLPPSGITD
jgi:hypothetical protein